MMSMGRFYMYIQAMDLESCMLNMWRYVFVIIMVDNSFNRGIHGVFQVYHEVKSFKKYAIYDSCICDICSSLKTIMVQVYLFIAICTTIKRSIRWQ